MRVLRVHIAQTGIEKIAAKNRLQVDTREDNVEEEKLYWDRLQLRITDGTPRDGTPIFSILTS